MSMLIGGAASVLVPLGPIALILYWSRHRPVTLASIQEELEERLGGPGPALAVLLVLPVSMVFPFGLVGALCLLILLGCSSPAARATWRGSMMPRAALLCTLMILTPLTGLLPVSNPPSPLMMGADFSEQDTSAGPWPTEQRTVQVHLGTGGQDLAVVTTSVVRTPFQTSPWGADRMMMLLASTTGADEARMDQALDAMQDQLRFLSLDEDSIRLVDAGSIERRTVLDASGDEHHLLSLRQTVNSDLSGRETQLLDVRTMAYASWGGEVHLLTVLRPMGSNSIVSDPYAEVLTAAWLEHS